MKKHSLNLNEFSVKIVDSVVKSTPHPHITFTLASFTKQLKILDKV